MIDLGKYFDRIGYNGPRKPTIEVLNAILARQPDAIAFEALDPLVGKVPDVSPTAVDAKLLDARHGGYCFEQNALLLRALRSLGFDAEGLIARVWWMRPDDAPPGPWSHMAVQVRLNGRDWLADSDFGSCVPTAALDFGTAAPQDTAHERFRVTPSEEGWMLEAELDGRWARVYEVRRTPAAPDEYRLMNERAATRSHFASDLILARTTPEERIVVAGNRLTRRGPSGIIERAVLDANGLEEVIRTRFRLPFDPRWRAVLERAATHPR
ncbi:MAG: arylamine N-acetyltransferase [Paracoccaceae bacterium]